MIRDKDGDNQSYFDFAPWSVDSSLKEKASEVGVDYDALIEGLRLNKSDMEIAREFSVPEGTIRHLRDHFESEIGLNNIMGH
ncbi:helix-turn-helix domain-containing protein [Paradesulfitobacterium ferrireducens]|uniref:helix-turn-helix domain-containing protein n=1 Tax=Paradesulfitobacterium ferrireducens TaxID=2816476 RepID=UPI001A8C3EED|nr:helix-turn-helix domain-containing protein [Paradesulfitobacterium ferrireducens]